MGDTRRRKADTESAKDKPQYLAVVPDDVPAELRERKQWFHWRADWKEDKGGKGKWGKVPRSKGSAGSSTNPATWMEFNRALAHCRRLGHDGVGFVFDEDDPFAGVDLDDCRDPDTGALDAWAAAIVAALDSYTEVSPSGTGVKVWVRGKKPPGDCKRKYETGEVEVYDQGRYFAVTGRRVEGTPATVNERQAQLEAVYRQAFPEKPKPEKPKGPSASASRNGDGHLGDNEVLARAARAKNGAKFLGLWGGDTSGHGGDESRADMALCQMLAFWCNKDAAQMDRLFRQSGLFRDKWDDRRGESTYGQDTIEKAIALCGEGYEPPVKVKWPKPGKRGKPAGQGPEGAPSGQEDAEADEQLLPAYKIILAHFREHYRPAFRRGQVLYSDALGREVKMGEACSAAGIVLIDKLIFALDAPELSARGNEIDRTPLNPFFRKWAPTAYKDLLDTLPDEERSEEVIESAEDEFRGKVAAALYHHAALGYVHADGETRVERRTLLSWCRLFAKSVWGDIRGYQLWCRKDKDDRLQVALRRGLFGQVQGCAELARLSSNKLTRLAELYGVGAAGVVRGGRTRVVVLTAGFLAYLSAQPDPDDTSQDGGETHAGTRESEVSKCHESGEPPGGQGVAHDTSHDTSAADAQSVMRSVMETPSD